jgi:hypothetical protein
MILHHLKHEIAKTEVSSIPYGISPKTLSGGFIQEGADNIDLNTETIDGSETTINVAENEVQYRIRNMP